MPSRKPRSRESPVSCPGIPSSTATFALPPTLREMIAGDPAAFVVVRSDEAHIFSPASAAAPGSSRVSTMTTGMFARFAFTTAGTTSRDPLGVRKSA